ncbi:hypothetical protein CPLU01_15020, partial [Colletotrichum plurivorum]
RASLNAVLSLNTASERPVKTLAISTRALREALMPQSWLVAVDSVKAALRRIDGTGGAFWKSGLPLTVDIQGGYEEFLGEVIGVITRFGAVGADIEDSTLVRGEDNGWTTRELIDAETQASVIRAAIKGAAESNLELPDFVVNARCDVFRPDLADPWCGASDAAVLAEAVRRGRMYLEFGATTVTYAGGPGRGLRREEIEVLVRDLGGMVGVRLGDGEDALTTRELAEIGVARIDVGDSIYQIAMNAAKEATARILGGGRLKA